MKTINDYLDASEILSEKIKQSFRELAYKNEEDFQNMDISTFNPDEMLAYNELRKAFSKLEDFNYILAYLSAEVQSTGTLRKNTNGRYELANGYEFTSGNPIEALIYDEFNEVETWVRTSVESNENGYYLVGYKNVSMDGLKVRIRSYF